jgi:hypothetical protein
MIFFHKLVGEHVYLLSSLPQSEWKDVFQDIPQGIFFDTLTLEHQPTLKGGWIFPKEALSEITRRIDQQETTPSETDSISSTHLMLHHLNERIYALEKAVFGYTNKHSESPSQ